MLPPDVVAKLNECANTDFVGKRDWWFLILSGATGLVVAALILEGPELVYDLIPIVRKILAKLRKLPIESLKYEAPGWVKVVAFLGWIFIVVGVVGEEYAGIRVKNFDANIQECSDAKVREATMEAGDAKASATEAADAAQRAKDEASGATKLAQTAHREVDSVHQEVGNAASQLTQLEGEAQKTKSDLINLAVCNAPRVITQWSMSDPSGTKSYVDSLRPMAGQTVFIEFVPDAEARPAALNLARALADAQWSVRPLKVVDGLADGVSVQPSLPVLTESAKGEMLYLRASGAAEKLVDFLHSYNWQAAVGAPRDAQGKIIHDEKTLPLGAIQIQIGLYPPAVYVSPPGEKELTSRAEELKQEEEKKAEKAEAERLAKLPPGQRKIVERQEQEFEAGDLPPEI